MSPKIGVIAEDQTDVEVIEVLIGKISRKAFRIESFQGNGSGKIRSKCNAWAKNLHARGCKALLLVHDLDDRVETQLMTQLQTALNPCAINPYLISIPIREIEAWLLADHEAIGKTFKFKNKSKKVANPEAILNPKEKLRDLIWKNSEHKRQYLTAQNSQIAKECDVVHLKRCSSFVKFYDFVTKNIKTM